MGDIINRYGRVHTYDWDMGEWSGVVWEGSILKGVSTRVFWVSWVLGVTKIIPNRLEKMQFAAKIKIFGDVLFNENDVNPHQSWLSDDGNEL